MSEHNTAARKSCWCNNCKGPFSFRELDAHFLCATCRTIPGVARRAAERSVDSDEDGWPSLVDQLRRDGFPLVPNYARPLDGRIVGTRCDAKTGQLRNETDYECVGRILGARNNLEHSEELGRQIRQTWDFRADDMKLRVNEFWENSSHYGLQYCMGLCWGCGCARWINADRPPTSPRCKECRAAFRDTPRCPDLERACSTAYVKFGCRCAACLAWKVDKNRRSNASRRGRSNFVSTEVIREKKEVVLFSDSYSTNEVTSPHPWPWLPEAVRASLARYEAACANATEAWAAKRAYNGRRMPACTIITD